VTQVRDLGLEIFSQKRPQNILIYFINLKYEFFFNGCFPSWVGRLEGLISSLLSNVQLYAPTNQEFFFLHGFMQYFLIAKGLTVKIDLGLIDQLSPILYMIFTTISIWKEKKIPSLKKKTFSLKIMLRYFALFSRTYESSYT
jgi:hypothetical protein